jgi:hypothetical protein
MGENRNERKKQVQKLNEIKYLHSSHNLRKAKEMMVTIGEVDEELSADLLYWKGKVY